jgi:hypothetical protein
VLTPILISIIDITTIPGFTLFFGNRFLRFSVCAAAKAREEKSSRDADFQAGAYLFHIFLVAGVLIYFAMLPHDALRVRNRPSTDGSTMI